MRYTQNEQDMLQQFVRWGEQQATVRAIIMTSSRTTPIGTVDLLSDYDLILIIPDIAPFHHSRAWLADFGDALALYRDPITLDGDFQKSGYVIQFENGLKIDFSLWSVEVLQRVVNEPELPDEFDAGYRVLLDKDHLTNQLKPPSYTAYIPAPPTESIYQSAIEVFFLDATYMAKFLWRNDMIVAKHMLDHFIKHEHLIPMLVWHIEINNQWIVKPGLYGQRLKKWLRPDLWTKLENTYVGVGLEENWDALFLAITLYREVAIEVGKHLGYAYLHNLDQRANAYLYKVNNLPHDADNFPN